MNATNLTSEQKAGFPTCSTFDELPIDGTRLVISMWRKDAEDPFWAQLPASAAEEATARRELIKEIKLMFELGVEIRHDFLSRDLIAALYATAPDDEFSCGVSARASVAESCRTWGRSNEVDGPLGLCQRMLSSHVQNAVFQSELAGCLGLLSKPVLSGVDSCAAEYRGLVQTVSERLLVKSFASIKKSTGTEPITGIDGALARIDQWYTAAAAAFATDPAGLSDATGRVLSTFWTQVYSVGSPVPGFAVGEGAASDTAKRQLSDLFATRIETDRQVLQTAFSDPAPLDEVPLLLIASDGFSAISERLFTSSPFYDLACQFKGSCSVAEANEATLLIRLLGAIGDDNELAEALAAANNVVRTPWRDLFTTLRARRGALEAALRKATGRGGSTLSDLYLPSAVASVASLAEKVAKSSAMWSSYVSHGVLQPSSGLLRTSLSAENVTAALDTLLRRHNTLVDHRRDYQRTRGEFAQTIASRIANKQFSDRVNNDAAVLRAEYDNIGRDLNGLMSAQDQAEQQIGSFLTTYVARASGPGWLPDYPIDGHPEILSFDASVALGSGSLATDVPVVAVRDPLHPGQPWRLDVARGDVLTFGVTGAWSPTCALRDTTLASPTGPLGFSDPTHLTVGTEGFGVTWETDHFKANEHTSTDFTSVTTTTSVCGSAGAGVQGAGSLSGSASACRQWQTGHSESDSSSSGSRFQYSANFSGGLRVPGTPFPSLPAGSLLLVEVVPRAGGGTMIRDAHVVRSHAGYVFQDAATVYLVANDKGGCRAIDTHALSLTYVHGHSALGAAQSLAEAMAAVLASLHEARATYVAQGSVTATELSALQANAYEQLRASCHCDLNSFPQEVRGMFDAWLGTELASIERQTRIASSERTLDSLVLRLKGMQSDLDGAESSSRLLGLLTYWQLGHLAYHLDNPQPALRTTASLLVNSVSDALALMQIQYPQALAALREASGPITALRTIDWTLPYDEQVVALENLAEVSHELINSARNAGNGASATSIVVVFPKPGVPVPDIPTALVVAPERAAAVWEPCAGGTGTCLRQRPTFVISPEDVYGRPLVGLGCGDAAPVVQSFALVAVNNFFSGNDDWNNNPRRADIFRASDMQFPAESGTLSYRTDGPNGILAPSRVRVLATDRVSVTTTFNTLVRQGSGDLQGVSPFNAFTVDLGPAVGDALLPLKSATAMVAFFDVQNRTATGPLRGVSVCAEPNGIHRTLEDGATKVSPDLSHVESSAYSIDLRATEAQK